MRVPCEGGARGIDVHAIDERGGVEELAPEFPRVFDEGKSIDPLTDGFDGIFFMMVFVG